MPYERQTRSTGYRNRTGVITNSNKLAQQAKQLDKERIESVRAISKQTSDMVRELNRIDQVKSSNDQYNLQQLANFSDILSNTLRVATQTVGKDYITQKREEGILKGRRHANGDTSAFDLDEEQTAKIEEAVAKQKIAVNERLEKFDEQAYRATLQEKARALNLRRMGSNIAWGYKRGYLAEKAKGWDAYRTTMLGTSKEVIGTTEDGKDIVVGRFWQYEPEIQQKITEHVENQFIKEVTEKTKINQAVINTHLIKPVTEETSKFQEEVLSVAIRDQGKEELDALDLKVTSAIKSGNKKEIRIALEESLKTLRSITRRMSYGKDLRGTLQETANALLAEMIVDAVSSDEATFENIGDLEEFLTTEKFEIPGITKKAKYDEKGVLLEPAEKKLLSEIWPSQFNNEEIIGKAIKTYNAKLKEKDQTDLDMVNREKADILSKYYSGEMTLVEAKERSSALRDKYEGVPGVHTSLFNLDEELRKPKYLTPTVSKKAIDALIAQSVEGTINASKLLPKDGGAYHNPDVVAEYRKQGLIVDKEFLETPAEIQFAETFDKQFEEHVLQNALGLASKDDRDAIGTQKVLDYARHWLIAEAKNQKANDPNLTTIQALNKAAVIVKTALKHDHDDDNSTKSKRIYADGSYEEGIFQYDSGTKRWIREDLNELPLVAPEQGLEKRAGTREIENTFLLDQGEPDNDNVDLLSTKSYIPKELFKLTNGEPLPIFTFLSNTESRGNLRQRNKYEIYNLQAALHEGIEPIEIPESVQKTMEMEDKLSLANADIIANSPSSRATGRVLTEMGIVDSVNLQNTLAFDGKTLVTADELPELLEAADLSTMSYNEVLKNPKVLKKVTRAKLEKLIEIANKKTDNAYVAVRMAAVGMLHGEEAMGEWNTTYADVSREVAMNYVTGDYPPVLLDREGILTDSQIYIKDGRVDRSNDPNPVTRTLPTTLVDLQALQAELQNMEKPAPKIDMGQMTGKQRDEVNPIKGVVGDFFNLNKDWKINPEYAPYLERVQRVNDLITIIEGMGDPNEVYDPNNRKPFSRAAERILGEVRWNNLLVEARENPAWGTIAKTWGTESPTQIISALLMAQPEFEGIDFTFDDIDDSLYTLDSRYSGAMPDELLVSLNNNASLARQIANLDQNFRIRRDVAPDLIRLVNDATKAGHKIKFTSGYRSYSEQVKEKEDARAKGKPWLAANPGESQHGLGKAIDINLPHTKDENDNAIATAETRALHKWIMDNKHKYNFHTIEGFDVNIGEDGIIPDEAWHFEWRKPN